VARRAHLVDEARARDAGDRLLAGGVDVTDGDDVGFVERAREVADLVVYLRTLSGKPPWTDVPAEVRKISRGESQ